MKKAMIIPNQENSQKGASWKILWNADIMDEHGKEVKDMKSYRMRARRINNNKVANNISKKIVNRKSGMI